MIPQPPTKCKRNRGDELMRAMREVRPRMPSIAVSHQTELEILRLRRARASEIEFSPLPHNNRALKVDSLSSDGYWHAYFLRLTPDGSDLTCNCPAGCRGFRCKHLLRAWSDAAAALGSRSGELLTGRDVLTALRHECERERRAEETDEK